MLGVEGAMDFVLAGSSPQRLAPLTAAFAPANVQHGNVNGDAPTTYVEFQPVLRPDWYPPHPRRPREGTPTPQPIPEGLKVSENFAADSAGWRTEGQARWKSLVGKTARVTVWELPAGAKPVDITTTDAVERFVFVIDGTLSITDGPVTREIVPETLVIIPGSARAVQLGSGKRMTARVAVFEALH